MDTRCNSHNKLFRRLLLLSRGPTVRTHGPGSVPRVPRVLSVGMRCPARAPSRHRLLLGALGAAGFLPVMETLPHRLWWLLRLGAECRPGHLPAVALLRACDLVPDKGAPQKALTGLL